MQHDEDNVLQALPSRGISLPNFNRMLIETMEDPNVSEEDYYHSLYLALTGIDKRENLQYALEPTANYFRGAREVRIVRDYDSLICFNDFIPVTEAMYIYPIANPTYTLTNSVHMKVPMRIHEGEPREDVNPQDVPNICIGEVDQRTRVRMFFPRLYQRGVSPARPLTHEQLAAVYEEGLYPIIRDIAPDVLTNWPIDYDGACIRARNQNGTTQYSSRAFPRDLIYTLGYELRSRLAAEYDWAGSIVFMTQIQGVKDGYQHHSTTG
ncbi:hypothetical protein HYDPIDRAFT_35121 [Hydnomerulius pinastri MD-312]|uniref:Uncharacterized protein n=1 Tax=Hydnomerulius pinastri MD-312 TaxID=994086 RepID=A0A0C2PG27_9AGAM|nr:hypothetical protein HYDPIDRAFT_35121 [Hydnomerulius pinastri MD-312]